MAITLNSTPITSNRINSQDVVQETLNGNIVYALDMIQRPEVYIHSSDSGYYGPTTNTINIQGNSNLYLSILLPLPAYQSYGNSGFVNESIGAISAGLYISLADNGVKLLPSLPGYLDYSNYSTYAKQYLITNSTPENGATYSNTISIEDDDGWNYNIDIKTYKPASVPD